MIKTKGYAAQDAKSPLGLFKFDRREPGEKDVQIQILYCGVCHTDLHQVRNDWHGSVYPIVPGHEIVGKVVKVGNKVKKFKEGALAAIGCMVDSCRVCYNCKEGLEQYCDNELVFTYNSEDKKHGGVTYGGYSETIVVNESFALRVPDKLNLAAAAPLLCAGITTYSPLRHWNVGKGHNIGIIGLGGLGHMAIKLAHAFGANVTVFTTSPNKKSDGFRFGAQEVVISKNEDEMKKQLNRFDFILNTVSATIDINAYLAMLKRDGTVTQVGAPGEPLPIFAFQLIGKRRQFAGSVIGGIKETQEMLDFCAEHNIVSDIELIPIQKINEAYTRMLKSDVKYRFVIDIASLKQEG